MSASIVALTLVAARLAATAARDDGGAIPALTFDGTLYKVAVALVSLSFFVTIGEQFLALRAGSRPDWGKPFVRTTAFFLLLGLYTPLATGIIATVKSFGAIDNTASQLAQGDGEGTTKGVLAERATAFAKLRERLDAEAYAKKAAAEAEGGVTIIPSGADLKDFVSSAVLSMVDSLLWALTWMTFTFAAFAIFALKILAGATTKILLEAGPVMVAAASLPGLTSRYLSAWVMALVEVTAWGVVARIILGLLVRVSAKSAGAAVLEDADYAEHIILNFVYAGMFLAVPSITHMVLSGSAASVGNTGMAAAFASMAGAARGVKSAPASAAVAGTTALAGAAGVAGASVYASQQAARAMQQVAERAGDAGTSAGVMTTASEGIRSALAQNQIHAQKEGARDLHARRGAIEKHRRGD